MRAAVIAALFLFPGFALADEVVFGELHATNFLAFTCTLLYEEVVVS
jgi:hypothetical protein